MRFTRKRIAVIGAVAAVAAAVAVPLAIGAVTATGTLSHYDMQQHDRLFRDGVPSDCHGKANPGLLGDAVIRSYDKYSFKNTATTSKCAHVFLQHACGVNAFAVANSPFVSSDPSLNYLGDAGQSGSPESFGFPVAAGQSFDVVVGQVDNPLPAPCGYAITVTIGGVQQPPAAATIRAGSTD